MQSFYSLQTEEAIIKCDLFAEMGGGGSYTKSSMPSDEGMYKTDEHSVNRYYY